ncbi:AAA family ATPase [Hydrogenophaga aromaticivorans]|uniref:AAA family ATPase n=1 Tax=Hydrogenophaga aromaticivorans TaxID=2610898 RepID=UPI0015A06A9B
MSYSTGKDVNKPGNLRPVEAGTLRQLADCEPVVLPTRADFAALQDEKQKRLKHGLPYFVGALLPAGVRTDSAVIERRMVTLDIEAPKPKANETATERATRRAKGQPPKPQDVDDMLSMLGYEHWVYSSLNHTRQAPRYRVVLPLSKPLQDVDLREITLAVAEAVGIPAHFVDGASWKLSQPMFLPAKYKDGEYWSSGAQPGAPWVASTAQRKTAKRQHVDPIVDGLMQAGLYLHEDKQQPGKHFFRCPFADDHGTVNESQTVYWEEGSRTDALDSGRQAVKCLDNEADHDGKPHLTLAVLKAWLRERLGDRFVGYERLTDFPDKRPGRRVDVPRFAVQSVHQFLDHDPLPWLIKGVLARGEICMIQGQSGAGKSFLALDMARCMVTGQPWNGMAVTGRLRVGYIAAEGVASIRRRVQAMLKHFKLKPEQLDIVFIADAPSLADEKDCVRICEAVLEATNGAGLDVMFIDTLARSTAGVNENSSEMSVPLKHLAAIHRATGATQIPIHHLGKDTERGGRGWSGIPADMDTILEVSKGAGDTRTIKVPKQRDGDESLRWSFELVSVPIGQDEDGEEVTSAVVAYSEFAQAAHERKLSADDKLLLAVLEEMHLTGDEMSLPAVELAFVEAKEQEKGIKASTSQSKGYRYTARTRLPPLCARSDVDFLYDEETKAVSHRDRGLAG